MVARKDDGPSAPSTSRQPLSRRLFTAWRAMLGGIVRRLTDSLRPPDDRLARRRALADRIAPFAVGWICLLTGALVGVALAQEPLARRAAMVAALSGVVWAFGRLLVLGLALHHDLEGPALRRAWAWGLAPYVIAVVPELTLVAWALSGLLTWWLLLRTGVTQRDANRGVLIAWGVQALFAAVAWVAVNGWVAFLSRS